MSSENWKILLDYKSELNVTKHSLNRECVLLFCFHVSLWQSTSASNSKLYSYNTSIRNPKSNVSDASRRLFSRLFKGSKHGSSYRGSNILENDLRGNENWFEFSGSSSYWGFELPRVKLQRTCDGNPGKSLLVRVSARFELSGVD